MDRRSFFKLAAVAAIGPVEEDLHDWRYDGRAYCHMDGGYYLHVMKRVILIDAPKKLLDPRYNVNDKGEKYALWGELIKTEYKLVNPQTGVEVLLPLRDHYMCTKNTQFELWKGDW
jgi:hypothetical protein